MSESYQKKKERWLRAKKLLPENLRQRVALRNIMAVTKLLPEQQQALAEALDIGLKRIPTALRYLETYPAASAQDLLRASLGNTPRSAALRPGAREPGRRRAGEMGPNTSASHQSSSPAPTHPEALAELISLLKDCYPDMNQHSAEALAESQALRDVLNVLVVYQQVFDSPHFNTDFVVVLFHKLLERTWERLNWRIAGNPAYQQALRLSSGQALRQAGVDTSANQGLVDQ